MEFNGYHFTSDTLRDGRTVPAIGETLVHDGDIEICSTGLHFSRTAWQAFQYAPGNILHRVMCEGIADEHEGDKAVCRKRTIVASIDVESLLREFGRKCALDVINLWDAPQVVIDYLNTGDENLRAAARDAAGDAERDAARAAARDAQAKLFDTMVDEAFARADREQE